MKLFFLFLAFAGTAYFLGGVIHFASNIGNQYESAINLTR
jgi:hypothetical protein